MSRDWRRVDLIERVLIAAEADDMRRTSELLAMDIDSALQRLGLDLVRLPAGQPQASRPVASESP